MKVYGIIGYPLGHSFSQKYFTEKFSHLGITNCRYEVFPIESVNSFGLLKQPALCGLNVTIPHKQSIIQYCWITLLFCRQDYQPVIALKYKMGY